MTGGYSVGTISYATPGRVTFKNRAKIDSKNVPKFLFKFLPYTTKTLFFPLNLYSYFALLIIYLLFLIERINNNNKGKFSLTFASISCICATSFLSKLRFNSCEVFALPGCGGSTDAVEARRTGVEVASRRDKPRCEAPWQRMARLKRKGDLPHRVSLLEAPPERYRRINLPSLPWRHDHRRHRTGFGRRRGRRRGRGWQRSALALPGSWPG